MAVNIILKRSGVPGKVPTTSSLQLGELALNTYDGKAFLLQQQGAVKTIIELASTSGSILSASYADFAANSLSSSYALTASYALNLPETASYALTASLALTAISSSYAATSSYADNFTVAGTLTAQTIVVQVITSSQELVTGSLTVNGPLNAPGGITGSLFGTASYSSFAISSSYADNALSASYAINADLLDGFDSSVFVQTGSFNSFTQSYLNDSSSFDVRINNNSASVSLLSGSYLADSSSFDIRINNNSSSIFSLSSSFLSTSGSFSTRITDLELFSASLDTGYVTEAELAAATASLSGSIAYLSSSYLADSGSFDTRINNNSASIALLSGSYLADSSSFDTRISNNSASISSLSGSFLNASSSFDVRINNNSASIASLSGSFLSVSSSFDTRITNNSGSIASLSSSFLAFSASFNTGSFVGSFTGSFSGSLANLKGSPRYIPFFSSSQILDNSALYQVNTASIAINETNVNSTNPEALYVFQTHPTSINVISGKGNLNNYLQLNIQNTNQGTDASSDIVATANNGDEGTNYVDLGINSENYSAGFVGAANDAYLYNTGSDFHIGNITPNKHLGFFVGGSDVVANNKLQLNTNNQHTMTGSLFVSGSVNAPSFTGSLHGTSSWAISSSQAVTASYALVAISSSYALSASVAVSASHASTASFLNPLNQNVSINGALNVSGSVNISGSIGNVFTANIDTIIFSGSILATGSIEVLGGITGSLNGTASWANNAVTASNALTASYVLNAVSASYALSASNAATASSADDFVVRGTLTAQTVVAQVITSSTEFVTGSTKFGTLLSNTHQFTGSVTITGSLGINGVDYTTTSASFDTRILNNSASIASLSSSFLGASASFDTRITNNSASIALLSGSYLADSASFGTRITNNSASISLLSGSYLADSSSFDTRITNNSASISSLSSSFLNASASFDTKITNNSASIATLSSSFLAFSSSYNTGSFTGSFTGSLLGTASYALYAISASYAATASSADQFNVRNALTASGLRYPIADNGEESFMQTDGNGVLSLQYVKTIYEEIYNGEATNIVKGTPVYVSGSVGAASIVFRADAGNPAKMPVVYISADTIAPGATGRGIALGLIKGVDTTGYPAGTEIYIAVGGGWTSTRPTGSAIVQVLGYVTKEGSGGQGVVLNSGPNNLPNLLSGSAWVGNSSSVPVAIPTSSFSVAFAVSSSYASSSSHSINALTASSADNFTVRGTLTAQTIVAQVITSSTDFVTGSTRFGSLLSNTHQFTGSVSVTGSLNVNNSPVTTGTGANGQVTFWTGTGTQSGSNNLFWDNANGRLGVGTNAPSSPLHIKSNVTGNATSNFRIDNSGTAGNEVSQEFYASTIDSTSAFRVGRIRGFFSNSSFTGANLVFQSMTTGNTLVDTIMLNQGNVLIGSTTSSGERLQVSGSTSLRGTTATDGGQLGSELLTSSGWTTTGWTGDFTTGFTNGAGNTSPLSNSFAAVISTAYQIAYTITGRTAGSVTIALGGQSTSGVTATGAFGPTATTTGNLVITPTSDFNGTIVLSLRTISNGSATLVLRNSAGTITNEIRSLTLNNNVAIGLNSGRRITTGASNSFYGSNSGVNNTTGNQNSFYGWQSGFNNTTGTNNSFFGVNAGFGNTTGAANSFFGFQAGLANTTGANNVFVGLNAGVTNTTANDNTFIGHSAGALNTTGASNTFVGRTAGFANTTGANNVFIGQSAGGANTIGFSNSFFGTSAGGSNTTGAENTFIGRSAGQNNTTGGNNVFLGFDAGRRISGGGNLTVASNSVFVGRDTRANADSQTNQIVIGDLAIGLGSNTTVIGNTSTTFGRWFGRLLLGTSTDNSTDALQVSGSTRIDGNTVITGSLTVVTGSAVELRVTNVGVTLGSVITDTHTVTGSLNVTGSSTIIGRLTANDITGSLFGTASWATNALTASSADNFTVRGTLTAQTIVVQTITSSTDFVTGSTRFGSLLSNTHQFTGSVTVTGSLNVDGPTTLNNLTGSLFGTASYADNALSASYANNALSSSYALTASFVPGYVSGSGASGQVAFWTGTNTQSGNNNLFWDISNNRLGVGTTSPGGKFESINSVNWVSGNSLAGNFGNTTVIPNAASVGTVTINSVGSFKQITYSGNATLANTGRHGSIDSIVTLGATATSNVTVSQASTIRAISGISAATYYNPNSGTTLTISHLAGIRVLPDINAGAGSVNVTNKYGLLIGDASGGAGTITYTNRWGIYQEGANDNNYFAGKLFLNTPTTSSFQLDVNGTTRITGNTTISGSLEVTGGITGSLFGTASNAVSSSYALTASYAENAGAGAGFPFSGSAVITGSLIVTEGITGSLFGTASFALNIADQGYVHTQSVATSSWEITHLLQTQVPLVQVYDSSFNQIIPSTITVADPDKVIITFAVSQSGYAIISKGSGVSSTAAISSSYALTASYAENAASASFATTAVTASYGLASETVAFNIGTSAIYTGNISSTVVGSNNMFTTSTGSFASAFYKYVARSGSNARAGEVMAVWSGGSVQFTDTSTLDIGSTNAVTASVSIVSNQAQLNFQTNTSGWNIRSQATLI